MLWPAAMITLSILGAAVDDRQAVVGHRPPAEPLFLHRLAIRLAEIVGRPVLEELETLGADRLVIAGELHGRAQAVARLERRDRDAGLGKDQRDLGTDARAGASSDCIPLPGWIGTRQPRCSFRSGVHAPAATMKNVGRQALLGPCWPPRRGQFGTENSGNHSSRRIATPLASRYRRQALISLSGRR